MSRRDLLTYLQDFGWDDIAVPAGPGPKGEPAHLARGEAHPPLGLTGQPAQPPPVAVSSDDPLATPDLAAMAHVLAGCHRCRLCQARKQVVFGVGNPHARVVFVGEGPGADEDRLGEPFVGKAGQLLNEMLPSIGLRRGDVYIANIVKCRPPGNRDPEPDEAAACLPFLKRQIELVDPVVIVCLGRIAARYLLGTTAPISGYRGRWTRWEGREVLPTYHPAYLLRNPAAKRDAWTDLKRLQERLRKGGEGRGSRNEVPGSEGCGPRLEKGT